MISSGILSCGFSQHEGEGAEIKEDEPYAEYW